MPAIATDSETFSSAVDWVASDEGVNAINTTSAIGVRRLCKSYDGPLAVDNVSFDVAQGEFLTLLGPSGSGKTSTLMLVAGFEQLTSGEITLHGRDIVDLPPRARDLGVVFQHYSLFPHMSVLDNVMFPLRMRKVKYGERRRQAIEMLERVDLAGLRNRRPRQLSGGQQQRVALARALVFNPAALLLDEPLGALDKRLRDQLQIEIKSIQKKLDVSVLFVTHDQEEAMMMSDRIAVMNHGRIEQIGSPKDLYNQPDTSFIATFLGETNLVPCIVESVQGDRATVTLPDGSRCGARAGDVQLSAEAKYGLSIRPERLKPVVGRIDTDGYIEGLVKSRAFLGASHRLVVEGLGRELVVSVADGAETLREQPGDTLQLGWDACDAQLITLDETAEAS